MDEIIDDDFHEKENEPNKFVYGEIDNFVIARAWKFIIKGQGGTIKGDCNEVLLDFEAELNGGENEKTIIKGLKQLQSAEGSLLPKVADIYKRLKILKAITGNTTDILLRPKSFIKDSFAKLKYEEIEPHHSYFIAAKNKNDYKVISVLLEEPVLVNLIEDGKVVLLKINPRKKELMFVMNVIPHVEKDIEQVVNLFTRICAVINQAKQKLTPHNPS